MNAHAGLAAAASSSSAIENLSLFPFAEYWWFYAAFTVFVFLLLALDLGVFHRHAHEVSFKEAASWSVVWVSLAMLFLAGFYYYMLRTFPDNERLMAVAGFEPAAAARSAALQFLAGYVVEYSLSVDNIFVFVVVLSYFMIPTKYQHRVLFFGILGALFFRAIFIAIGAALMRYQVVLILFGVFLIYTGVRMLFAKEHGVEPEENAIIKRFRRMMPVTQELHEQSFFVKIDGVRHATPLFIALLFLEMTDIVFAVDSVPAIFGLTREPLIVFTSNIFAILGLRNLYFMLRGAIDRFHMLKYGLGIVLIFVGLKMTVLNRLFGGHFPIEWSLGIIVGVIAVSVVLSLLFPRRGGPAGAEVPPVPLPPGHDLVTHDPEGETKAAEGKKKAR
ncbi:MAG TPA: TerC family protein [Vicinamibacteria bacterium]|nr:TerC family protein [Vicinamibacteria bacterium]